MSSAKWHPICHCLNVLTYIRNLPSSCAHQHTRADKYGLAPEIKWKMYAPSIQIFQSVWETNSTHFYRNANLLLISLYVHIQHFNRNYPVENIIIERYFCVKWNTSYHHIFVPVVMWHEMWNNLGLVPKIIMSVPNIIAQIINTASVFCPSLLWKFLCLA